MVYGIRRTIPQQTKYKINFLSNSFHLGSSITIATDTITENYQLDSINEGFVGSAKYANASGETSNHRFYEFSIRLSPSNQSKAQDATIKAFFSYAIKIGFNNTDAPGEILSNSLIIQVGPKGGSTSTIIGEYEFNADLFILIE